MSYDLKIYSNSQIDNSIKKNLIDKFNLSENADSLILENNNWQVYIDCQLQKIEKEDIPENIINIIPGIRYQYELNLTPFDAPKSGINFIQKIAKYISKEVSGVVLNEQSAELYFPNNPRRVKLEKPVDKRIDLLSINFWLQNSLFETKKDFEKLFSIITKYCPEFFPYRYGLWEPPQFKMEDTGKNNFIEFIWEHRKELNVLYTKKPFYGIGLPIVSENYYKPHGFFPKHIDFELDLRVLENSGWELTLKRFWEEMNDFLNPFYSDIRILKNHIDGGRTSMSDNKSELHPVRVGWKGLPSDFGKAVYFGEPYKSLLNLKQDYFCLDNWSDDKKIINDFIDIKYCQIDKGLKNVSPWDPDLKFFAEIYPFDKPENYKTKDE